MSSPIDMDVRQRASTEHGVSLALTAGAGSGKTTVLVERVINALRAGVDPSRIAAITFTEKAAGELEERVRTALEDSVASAPALMSVLLRVGELQTATIHSFCQTLLIEEALEAAWNPGAEILDAAFAADATVEAYDAWWRRFEADCPDVALLVHETVSGASLRRLAALCLDYRDLEPITSATELDWPSLKMSLDDITSRIEAASAGCTNDEDKLLEANAKLRKILRHARSMESPTAAVGLVVSVKESGSNAKNKGRAADWGADGKQPLLDAVTDYHHWCADVRQRMHGVVVRHLRKHFVSQALRRKTRSGEYDFQDLLFQSAALLADHPGARARLAARYDAVCIDEVQDTDPIQAEVALLLTRDPALDGAWNDHPPRPGALFAVGDPKQSIYRFRRADVATWRSLREAVASGGEQLSLVTNFRSVPGIVEWVNHTFAQMPDYEPQHPHRSPAQIDPVVLLDARASDASSGVLRYLHHLRGTSARVTDPNTGELRPFRWKDIMILLPAWTAAAEMQRLFASAGIEAVVEGGKTFFARDEVRLSLAAMRSLEEPADAEATVFVLRGLFGFDHQSLVDFVTRGGSWRYTIREQPEGLVSDALEIFRSLHNRRERQSWVATLEQLLDECWAPAVWSGMGDGRTRLANVAKFHSLIREAERAAPTPAAVVRSLEELAKEDDERELPVVDFDSDAVRITTYFSAKGREAPIVLLAHSNRGLSVYNYGAAACVDREDRKVALRISGLEPPGWGAYEEAEKAELAEERRRWMYVAATRARDQLVIVRSQKDNLYELDLAARGLPDPDVEIEHGGMVELDGCALRTWRADELKSPATSKATFPGFTRVDELLDGPPRTSHTTLAARQQSLAEAIAGARRRSVTWRSVGQLVKKSGRAKKYEEGVGAAGGTIIHLVMSHIDLALSADELRPQLEPLVNAFAAEEGVDEEIRRKCLVIVENMLDHPVVERARQAPERWIETPFSFPDRGRIISGIIDLCFPVDSERKNWVVVDWKSNLPPEGTPERTSYEKQLAYYAKALIAAVTPCENVETVLVGPHPELLSATPVEEALELVDPDLVEVLSQLIGDGVPLPDIGIDVGEPIVGQLELAWPAHHFGVSLDASREEVAGMIDAGWEIYAARTNQPDWTERVYDEVTQRFDIERRPADDQVDEPTVAPPTTMSPPPATAFIPGASSELAHIEQVVRVQPEKRIVYARDLPREKMLELVAQGWMVIRSSDEA